MSNPYNIPYSNSYADVLQYIYNYELDTDYTSPFGGSLPSPFDSQSAYDSLTFISSKPSWASIMVNFEAAGILAYQTLFPLEYASLKQDYEITQLDVNKQDHSTNLNTFSAISVSAAAQTMLDGSSYSAFASAIATPVASAMSLGTAAFKDEAALAITASQISNATTIGRSVLTAVDAAAGRLAIGAGTSSFDGAYSSLTGKPSLATVATSGNYTDLSNKPTIPSATVDYYALTTKPVPKSFTNGATIAVQTVAAAANGTRLSTFRDAKVSYGVTTSAAVQIGVVTNVDGYCILEICSTNSATAADWQEIDRTGTGQNIGLAIALSSTQKDYGKLQGKVPSGYYHRVRSVNTSGTPTYAITPGQTYLDEPLQTAA